MTTKICITSDLHFGITKEKQIKKFAKRIIDRSDCDLFVIAGDIGEMGGWGPKCLELFNDVDCMKAAVLGNHDLWTRRPDIATSDDLWSDFWPNYFKETGWVHLEQNNIVIEGVAIVGTIGWYDYSHNELMMNADQLRTMKGTVNADGQYMDDDWDDVAFARSRRYWLFDRLTELQERDDIEKIVVITHVPIFPVQHIKKPGDNAMCSSYFYHYTMGDAVRKFSKVTNVVSGHTHRGVDTMVGDIHVQTVDADYGRPKLIDLEI